MTKVRELIEALKPQGTVNVWLRHMVTRDGKPFDFQVRLHKTELIAQLRSENPDSECSPFYVKEDPTAYRHWRRTVIIGAPRGTDEAAP